MIVWLTVFFLYSAQAQDRLTVLTYTAPTPLDWSTPGSLTRSTIDNSAFGLIGRWRDIPRPRRSREDDHDREYVYEAYPHAISHLNVELVCAGSRRILTGMTSLRPDGEYLNGLLLRGKSLETMLEDVPGGLIPPEKVLDWLPVMIERGYVRRVSWLISPKACMRLEQYFNDYQALGLEKIYGGLNSRPLEAKGGAGCAAFAMSFLEVAGLYDAAFEGVWKRQLRLRESYITRGDRLAERGIWNFLLYGYDGSWANEDEAHVKLDFWDPQLVFDWIGDLHRGDIHLERPPPSEPRKKITASRDRRS